MNLTGKTRYARKCPWCRSSLSVVLEPPASSLRGGVDVSLERPEEALRSQLRDHLAVYLAEQRDYVSDQLLTDLLGIVRAHNEKYNEQAS